MHVTLIYATKCPLMSELALVLVSFLKVRLGLPFPSWRNRVRRTLYDFHCPYFPPEVIVMLTRKARGHFVTLIEVGMHLLECNLEDISAFHTIQLFNYSSTK